MTKEVTSNPETSNLIQVIKETAAKAVSKHQAALAEQERLKSEQDNSAAQSTFDSLMQEMAKCEGTSGHVYISAQNAFGRTDFLELVAKKLDKEGFVAEDKRDFVFRYVHPEIPSLSIWCYSNKNSYGSVESHYIRFSFV